MNWFKKLFHKHKMQEIRRVKMSVGCATYNEGCMIDVQPNTTYIGTFVCEDCYHITDEWYTILDIFDRVQPYDKGAK